MRDFNVLGIPELPERISVETRIVSRETARLQNLNYTLDLTSSSDSGHSSRSLSAITPFKLVKSVASVEVMTDAPNPMRDRSLQTENETQSIAIQCNMSFHEREMEFEQHFEASECEKENEANTKAATEKESFLKFVKENSTTFGNGKLECLICAEIKKNNKSMESHMVLHWGPKKLCFRCGIAFDHKILWKNHNCPRKRPAQQQYIKCPHYFCAASLISPLELFDHLNEHCDIRLHKCSACSSSFPTAGELWLHFKLHKSCRKSKPNNQLSQVYNIPAEDTKYRKRVYITTKLNGQRLVVKRFLSQLALKRSRNGAYYCSVCLHQCRSRSQYYEHLKRCVAWYGRRQKCKRLKAAVNTILLNGNSIEID